MRYKVELHKEVARFLKKCDDETVSAFWERLDEVQADLFAHSEAISDPEISRYVLRYFRFAGYVALFQIDPTKDRIIVRLCRKLSTGRPPNRNGR